MHILYLCHRLPYPPKRGGKIRPFNMISHLSKRHEVTVATVARDRDEKDQGHGLMTHCSRLFCETAGTVAPLLRMVGRLPTPAPSSFGYFYIPRLKRVVEEVVARHDVDLIFVHCSSMAPYVADLDPAIPKILDFGDMDSQKWLSYGEFRKFPMSLGYWLEGQKLQRVEAELARKFDYCTATTLMEWETLEEMGTGVPSAWFPNGVDTDAFQPSATPPEPDHISFIGRMDYFPNQQAMFWFTKEVMPLIRAQRPAAKLSIIGADPSPAVRALAQQPGVEVTGSVTKVQPYVTASTVNVAPLQIARGTQNKILEAMAMGVPVVASPLAAKGIDAKPGEHLLTADTATEWAETVVRVLADPALRERLSLVGRERMLSHHCWPSSMARLDTIIDDCMTAQHAPPAVSNLANSRPA